MADYELSESGVRRFVDNASIPADPENRDWQAYLAWKAAGGVPDPMPEPPEPTEVDTERAAVLALIEKAGILTEEQMMLLDPPS